MLTSPPFVTLQCSKATPTPREPGGNRSCLKSLMPSVSQELTLRLKTISEGDYKALDPGTALSDTVSSPVTTLCTDTDHGFAFPPGNKEQGRKTERMRQAQALHDQKRDEINTFKELLHPKKNDLTPIRRY